MALKAGYKGLKNDFITALKNLMSLGVKTLGSMFDVTSGELTVKTATALSPGIVQPDGTSITINNGVISALSGSDIKVVTHTGVSTSVYGWITPQDENNNDLTFENAVVIGMFGHCDMSGAPPYFGSYEYTVSTAGEDVGKYQARLQNVQTGQSSNDGTFTVTYTVIYIEKEVTNNTNNRRKK